MCPACSLKISACRCKCKAATHYTSSGQPRSPVCNRFEWASHRSGVLAAQAPVHHLMQSGKEMQMGTRQQHQTWTPLLALGTTTATVCCRRFLRSLVIRLGLDLFGRQHWISLLRIGTTHTQRKSFTACHCRNAQDLVCTVMRSCTVLLLGAAALLAAERCCSWIRY